MLEVDSFVGGVGGEVSFNCFQEFQEVGEEVMVVGIGARVEAANDELRVSKKAAVFGPKATIDHEFNSEDGSFVFGLVRRYHGGCCYLICFSF